MRFMRASSGRLEPEEIRRLEQAFDAPVIVGLSSTESGWITVNPLPPKTRKAGSVGVPAINDVRLHDETGHALDVGQEGEVVVKGPLVYDGYLDDPEATSRSFDDGWYRTGDLGKFDTDGFLYLTGRIKDVINQGGEKISPAEIDGILASHPAVADGAAFGAPHPTLGQVVVAAVVLVAGAERDDRSIRNHVRAHLPVSKMPRKIFFVESLPRAENGKLRRQELQQELAPASL
jgi:acyl-CoA synthetase (AMP-forming)/AMP-acid ligase II